jgi:hypothetical protein
VQGHVTSLSRFVDETLNRTPIRAQILAPK